MIINKIKISKYKAKIINSKLIMTLPMIYNKKSSNKIRIIKIIPIIVYNLNRQLLIIIIIIVLTPLIIITILIHVMIKNNNNNFGIAQKVKQLLLPTNQTHPLFYPKGM